MAVVKRRTRIIQPVGSNSNSEVVEARSSATYGDFASLDARIENFELIVAGASHAAVTLAADLEPILSISAGQVLSLDSQIQNLAFLSPNGSTGDPTFRAIVAADLPATIVYNTRQVVAGAGLTGGGALSADVTLNVATADTSMTINPDSIQVRLAATSGLQISTGLMLADSVAGDGLTIASKVIAIGTPGSSTATSTNAVTTTSHTHAIDSTIARSAITITAGNGLTGGGNLTANRTITLGTPGSITSTSTNAVTTTSHTHAIDGTIATTADLHAQVHVLATTSALGPDHTVSGLTARQVLIATGATTALFRALQAADLPNGATLSVSSTNSGDSHAITTSSNPGAAASILASNASGYLQLPRIGLGVSPSYPLHAVSAANSEAFYVVANSITTGVAFSVEAPLSTSVNDGKAFQLKVNGEAFGRVMFYSDGKFGVGGGIATRDVFLSRSAANTWLVSSDGSTGVANIALNAGGTVDGVDISAHAANANAHHNQSHVLATNSALGADHTISGATAGHVLRASGATAAAFAQLQHSDLGGVSANQHHNQSHVLATAAGLGADHTVSGLTAGHVLRASSASAALFAQLQHSDLGGVSANQHHNQSHVLATSSGLGADHTVSGLTAGHVLVATSATAAQFQALTISSFPSFSSTRIYRTTAQTVGNNTLTAVSFTTEAYDVGSLWTAGSPTRVTINETGTWVFTAHVGWSGGSAKRYTYIRVNGTTTVAAGNTNGVNDPQSVATVYRVTAGDYVECMVLQDSGGNLDTLTGLNGCSFTATRIG